MKLDFAGVYQEIYIYIYIYLDEIASADQVPEWNIMHIELTHQSQRS